VLNGRFAYHDECKPLARAVAKAARRRCKRCRKVKAGSSFSDDSTRPDGKFPWCKDCQTTYATATRWQDADAPLNGKHCPVCDTALRGHINRSFCSASCKDKAAALRKRFGLTVQQYRAMVAETGGRCPICRNGVRVWNVDHDHSTGKVTGVVCTSCNVGALAMTYHDPALVRRLLAYLEHTPAVRLGIDATASEEANRPSELHRMWRRTTTG
jgi:predicted nucleic acid-binding Zn ribbon protein